MPLLSSLFGHNAPAPPPSLIFRSPDTQGIIRATTPQNQELAVFAISNSTLTRIRPSQQQVCTFRRSALSENTTITLHNQQIKLRGVMEGYVVGNSIDMNTPFGKLKWRPGSGGYMELREGRKALLARGKIHGTLHIRPSDLEVFVPGDEFLLDLILASWVAMYKGQEASPEDVEAAAEILNAVLGN